MEVFVVIHRVLEILVNRVPSTFLSSTCDTQMLDSVASRENERELLYNFSLLRRGGHEL